MRPWIALALVTVAGLAAAADLPSGCVAATTPETRHLAFARGCIARHDFTRAAEARDAAPAVASAETVWLPDVDVFGLAEPAPGPAYTLEQRFASALVQGNPEVNGGRIRHGAFYALGMYWGSDPLTFLYYNLRYRVPELLQP